MKRILAFDMDDTLTDTKTPVSSRMTELLGELLDSFDVCIVSGASYEQYKIQMTNHLNFNPIRLRKLHIMPTSGTRYYRYNETKKDWELQYNEDIAQKDIERVFRGLEEAAKESGYWPKKPVGAVIEDRKSQVTFTGLGHDAAYDDKQSWDPDGKKRSAIIEIFAKKVTDFEAKVAGTTSIDVTKPGIDKSYGVSRLMDILNVSDSDMLFFGDKLEEGGNDYPVKAMGIDTIAVKNWHDTAARLEAILAVIK